MRTHIDTFMGLTVGRLPRLVIYKPFAVLLAILVAPAFSWLDSRGSDGAASPFQLHAQVVASCNAQSNTIIQWYCGASSGMAGYNLYHDDLVQLESDAVNAYLAAHNLPAGDAHVIYDYGRADLRNAIRTYMLSTIMGIIKKPATSRSLHEQSLYNWMQGLVQQNEVALYQNAYNHSLAWQSDPCNFKLDPTIASAYGMSYDGMSFCGQPLNQILVAPPVPAPSYFTAYGLEQSYQSWAGKCPLPPLPDMTARNLEILGIAGASGAVLTGASAAVLATYLTAAIAAYNAAQGGVDVAIGGAVVYSEIAGVGVADLGFAASLSGPLAILTIAIAIGVSAGVQTFNYQDTLNQLNDLNNKIASNQKTPPDLTAFANDTTGLGIFKIENTFVPQTLHANPDGSLTDRVSTAPLPAHRPGTDLSFQRQFVPGTTDTLSYLGWNAEVWSAQTWGGWFVRTCANGTRQNSNETGVCPHADSISADLDFFDWNFAEWDLKDKPAFMAARFHDVDSLGNTRSRFTLVRAAGVLVNGAPLPASSPLSLKACPAGAGDLSPGPYTSNTSACWSYVTDKIPIVLSDGTRDLVWLADGVQPSYSQPSTFTFAAGVASTQTITVSGNPTPAGCVSTTNLPSNSDFFIGNFPASFWKTNSCNNPQLLGNTVQLSFNGDTAIAPGTYFMDLKFTNGLNSVFHDYVINVTSELGFATPGSMNVTAGTPTSFTVVATGYPRPKLSVDPLFQPDLAGLNFQDNGDGTATISGTYTSLFAETCQHVSPPGPSGSNCGIIATQYNPDQTIKKQVEQQFAINVSQAPAATLATPPATFTAGAQNQVILSAVGAATPVSWCFGNGFIIGQPPLVCASSPPQPWLSLKDNGDGTATLTGTPPVGTTGPVTMNIVPAAAYSFASSQKYTINVTNAPLFTSKNTAAFTVGSNSSFTVSATEGTISLLSQHLPPGLMFSPSGDTATISGTPSAGTSGQYTLSFEADAGTLGTAKQDLLLNINDVPIITSPPVFDLFAGQPGSVKVTTTGFPSTPGMTFSVFQGLPSFLSASNLNPAGIGTGTLVLSGTPRTSDIGTYYLGLQAQNTVGIAQQFPVLRVLPPLNPSAPPVVLIPQLGVGVDQNLNWVFSVLLTNAGSGTVQNVKVTSESFSTALGKLQVMDVEPKEVLSIPSGGSATFNFTCARQDVGFSTVVVSYTIGISDSAGSTSFSGRTSF